MAKYNEFVYRKFFHLSKEEMMQEPLEDFEINTRLMSMTAKKQKQESRAIEQRRK